MAKATNWIDIAKESYQEALDPGMQGLESQLMQFASAAALIAIAEILEPLIDDLLDVELDEDFLEADRDGPWGKRASD
jgi:hypothetical protein